MEVSIAFENSWQLVTGDGMGWPVSLSEDWRHILRSKNQSVRIEVLEVFEAFEAAPNTWDLQNIEAL